MTTVRAFRFLSSPHVRLATRILIGLVIVHVEAGALIGGGW